jgi:UDP-3-O-[3-hydroxymyristoyl] glucosamine N-acyltransferase
MALFRLADLAARLNLTAEGGADREITGVAGLREAEPGELSLLMSAKYAGWMKSTRASAVIVPRDWAGDTSTAVLRSDNPERDFTLAAQLFAPPTPTWPRTVHPTAVVAPDATLGADVHVGAHAVIESGAVIGAGTILCAQTYIGHGVQIGEGCHLYPHVSVREHCRLGRRVIVHNGSVIGSDGFGYAVDGHGVRTKIPQIGIVVVGDDVEIGANVTIDRARFGKTRIGQGVKIDNLVQIAHNVVIGDHAVVVAQVGIAGSTTIGKNAILAGQAGIAGHVSIGDGAIVGAQGGVTKDVPAKAYVWGTPAMPMDKFGNLHALVGRLPVLKERLEALEGKVRLLGGGAPKPRPGAATDGGAI